MNLERAINVMGWKMLGHSVTIPHQEQEEAAQLIKSKLRAAEVLAERLDHEFSMGWQERDGLLESALINYQSVGNMNG